MLILFVLKYIFIAPSLPPSLFLSSVKQENIFTCLFMTSLLLEGPGNFTRHCRCCRCCCWEKWWPWMFKFINELPQRANFFCLMKVWGIQERQIQEVSFSQQNWVETGDKFWRILKRISSYLLWYLLWFLYKNIK